MNHLSLWNQVPASPVVATGGRPCPAGFGLESLVHWSGPGWMVELALDGTFISLSLTSSYKRELGDTGVLPPFP